MLIVGGMSSSGTARTDSVCGRYWISSKTSVRSTTLPGVAARFPPTLNLLVSTVAGSRGGRDMSRTKLPRAVDEVGAAAVDRLLEHGRVDSGKLVGATGVDEIRSREPHLAFCPPVDPGVADKIVDGAADSEIALQRTGGRPSCPTPGSVNRRSPRAGLSSERPAATRPSSPASRSRAGITVLGRRARFPATFAISRGGKNAGSRSPRRSA